ncbi:TPA: monofunctional biosynthetic peptidoglycan transglycosylase [Neisseria weaveri]
MKLFKWLIILPFAAVILFNAYVYGNILTYRAIAPNKTAFMNMRMKEFRNEGRSVDFHYDWITYNKISTNLKKALIASEDAKFADHSGFDWSGIRNAIKRNQKTGKVRAGGSTISQQLAKNLFLNDQRSYIRKLEEAAITAMMEATTDKDRIFALYLNTIEWAPGVFGAEAAAQHFYQKPASNLSKQQAANLAARVPRPLYYAAHPNDKVLRNKTHIILKRMATSTLPPP